MQKYSIFLNPLSLVEIDSLLQPQADLTVEQIFKFLLRPGVDESTNAFVDRYREVSATGAQLSFAPTDPILLDKLVWPLLNAKGSYCLENYLGCIALCGMVGEMVAILIWEISSASVQGKRIDPGLEKDLFGSSFERLGQDKRTKVLRAFDLIDDGQKEQFDNLRSIRKKYLHYFSHPHDQAAIDSKRAFEDALKVVISVVGQTVEDGKIKVSPELVAYLTEKGVIAPGANGDGA